jgi:Transposase DDE domain
LFSLVERFKGAEKIIKLKSYRHMCRVLSEQCEITEGSEEARRVEVKAPQEVSADSLQSTSDPDATYDAHKGSGYQVQLMETYQKTKPGEKKDAEKPDLITYVEVEPASRSDMKAVEPALAETEKRGCVPEELLADGGYGSDANVESAREQQVELIAPANKGINKKSDALGLDGFEFDKNGEIVRCACGEKPLKTWRTKNGSYAAHFAREKCNKCELRKRCRIKIKARVARVPSYKEKQQRLAMRRVRERSEEYIDKYRWRAGEEATMSRYKSQTGAGRLRVRGMLAVSWAARLKALGLNILRCARAVSASAISAKTVQAYV